MDLQEQIETAARWIVEAEHVVVFTGAGISTDSGLPDFRGPDGVWTRRDKGLEAPRAKVPLDQIRPNASHDALARLHDAGKLTFLISQNVDNLHLESGIDPDRLAELHGNGKRLRCVKCGETFPVGKGWDPTAEDAAFREQPPEDETTCPDCGGPLRSSVVNFGDPLPQRDLMLSFEHSQFCDLFIAIGSSLTVTPAANMPAVALEGGAKLILINQGETPFDRLAHLRVEAGIGEVVPPMVDRALELLATGETT